MTDPILTACAKALYAMRPIERWDWTLVSWDELSEPLRVSYAESIEHLLSLARPAIRAEALASAAHEVRQWTDHNNAALRAGEMSPQEWRTAKAIVSSILRNIEALAAKDTP